jgi:hypothetical protein
VLKPDVLGLVDMTALAAARSGVTYGRLLEVPIHVPVPVATYSHLAHTSHFEEKP